jgi:hypothetical protein
MTPVPRRGSRVAVIDLVRPARKNLVLLAIVVAAMVAQPVVAHRSAAGSLFCDAALVALLTYVLFIVFARRWQRRVAVALMLPALAGNFGHFLLPPWAHLACAVVFHVAAVVFLGFAVAVILGGIFAKRVIGRDDVVGALCGYLLGALVWSNLYALTYLLWPEAFIVNSEIAWRLTRWHSRRALFDYLSFTTLTALGYSDITPGGPPVYSLTWLEVIFGQFYMAVVVAQLVGLKLAQAMKGDGPPAA